MQQAQALGMHVKQSNEVPNRDTVHPLWSVVSRREWSLN